MGGVMRGLARSIVLAGMSVVASSGFGADDGSIVGGNDLRQVEQALRALRMTTRDLSFRKDVVESERVPMAARRVLQEPLMLPAYAQHWHAGARGVTNLVSLVDVATRDVAGVDNAVTGQTLNSGRIAPVAGLEGAPVQVCQAVDLIYRAGIEAELLLRAGMAREPRDVLAAVMMEILTADQARAAIPDFMAAGFDGARLRTMLETSENLMADEDHGVSIMLDAAGQWNTDHTRRAALMVCRAVDEALVLLKGQPVGGEFQMSADTALGKVVCGGTGRNTYEEEAFLIVDLGGDDVYRCRAGLGSVILGRPISVVIDVAGNDHYVSRANFSQGAGVFGIGVLADESGDDVYAAGHVSQGAGVFGCGLLADRGGNDLFEADSLGQGAGMFGWGLLWQQNGDTRYGVRCLGQGASGAGGMGWLLDGQGNDVYVAGGERPCSWLPGQHFSMSQGFSIGMRPFAGGGTAVLCDLDGQDRYVADVYGQGAGYWYGVGMLIDAGGNDFYQAYQYAQGAGIHLSAGMLADLAGDDQYSAQAICQGGAHDYGVGMLVDRAGNDRYMAATTAQGSAIYNSVGLLLDRAGDDFYAGRDPRQSQAAGHDGGKREYGSIGLMIDMAGGDAYSQGQTNNAAWLKPFHGAGIDIEGTNILAGAEALTWLRDEVKKPGDDATKPASWRGFIRANPDLPVEKLLRRSTSDRPDAREAWEELKRGGMDSLRYLVTRLDSPAVMVRVKTEELVDALGTNSVPVLVEGLNNESLEVRRGCSVLLARFGDDAATRNRSGDRVIPALMKLADNDETLASALYALGHWRAGDAMGTATNALRHEKELVRLRAAQTLGRVGDRRAMADLVRALDDEMWTVRYAAETALVAMGHEARGPLRRAFGTASIRSKPHIVAGLAKLGDRRALTWARTLWRDDDAAWRTARMRELESYMAASGKGRSLDR